MKIVKRYKVSLLEITPHNFMIQVFALRGQLYEDIKAHYGCQAITEDYSDFQNTYSTIVSKISNAGKFLIGFIYTRVSRDWITITFSEEELNRKKERTDDEEEENGK